MWLCGELYFELGWIIVFHFEYFNAFAKGLTSNGTNYLKKGRNPYLRFRF